MSYSQQITGSTPCLVSIAIIQDTVHIMCMTCIIYYIPKGFFLKQYSHWFPFLYTACFKFAINSTNIMQPFFSNSWEEGYYSGAPTPQARHQGKQIYMNKISIGWTISHSTAVINYSLLC